MISSTVNRGIESMEEDPKRSIRRLADLGRRFSKSSFHDQVFSVIQELLSNEDSHYYDMIANLLKNSDHEALRTFGLNIGYMSWTYGARIIRKEQKENGICIPWAIKLRYDSREEGGMTLEDIDHLISQGVSLRIYSYMIRHSYDPQENYAIFDLFQKYPDCTFMWVRDSGRLTAAQIEFLKECRNTLTILPCEDQETLLTAHLIRSQKIIFALSSRYRTEEDITNNFTGTPLDKVLSSETGIYMQLAEDDAELSAEPLCYNSRLEQRHPVLITDYYGDCASIGRAAVDNTVVLEIGADGKVIRPAFKAGMSFGFDKDLLTALREIMPAYQK